MPETHPTSSADLSRLRIDRDAPAPQASRGRGGIVVAIVLLLLLGAAAAYVFRARPIKVEMATAEATGGSSSAGAAGISANGYVVARTKASVAAKIPGRLEYMGVTEGSRVKKGQIIARVESGDYEAQLANANATVAQFEAQLAQAKRDRDRAKTLRDKSLNADVDVEGAETNVSVVTAQLDAARAQRQLAAVNLENTRVRAPFDGTVLRKDAELGEIVMPSSAGGGLTRTAIATMADLSTLEVEVDVNEAYIAQIGDAQSCAITLDAYPDTSFRGRVRQVVPTADRQKATVLVKVSILDRDPRILPEMGAKVVFLRPQGAEPTAAAVPRHVTVPKLAVVTASEGPAVWIVQDGVVTRHSVELGNERGESIEIRSGLSGGETVVVSPPAALKNGAKVRAAAS